MTLEKLLKIEHDLAEHNFIIDSSKGVVLLAREEANSDSPEVYLVADKPFFLFREEAPINSRRCFRLIKAIDEKCGLLLKGRVGNEEYVVKCFTTKPLGKYCLQPYVALSPKFNISNN